MPTPERIVNQRIIDGINRIEDARIEDAGSWWMTQDFYGRQAGVLAKRPGSKVIVNGKGDPTGVALPPIFVPLAVDQGVVLTASIGAGEFDVSAITVRNNYAAVPSLALASTKASIFATTTTAKGSRQLSPNISAQVVPAHALPNDLTTNGGAGGKYVLPIKQITSINRAYFEPGKRFLLGSVDLDGFPDQIFYVSEANQMYFLASPWVTTTQAHVTSQGALFQFIPFRMNTQNVGTATDIKFSYWGIMTNGVDAPIAIKRGTDVAGLEVSAVPLSVRSSDLVKANATPILTDKQFVAVQSLAIWQGSVVYGGYRLMDTQATPTTEKWDNYIAFSDPGEPHKISQDGTGIVNSVRVGDSEGEPITGMSTIAITTNNAGIKAQLVVFTSKRVVIFDGLPPVSGTAIGTNFTSTIVGSIGCNAPRSIVATKDGVIFLGSDGIIYLIRGADGLIPIGQQVRPIFVGMSPRQQKQCSAFYDPEGFYKISYPDGHGLVGKGGFIGQLDFENLLWIPRKDYDIPDRQLWADLREIAGGAQDANVKWWGPMTGMKHSCFCVATGADDRGEVFAGSAVDGSIFQINIPTRVVDPSPEDPATDVAIVPVGITGLFDLGDAHIDKTVTALSYGFGTSNTTDVESAIIINSDDVANALTEVYARTITPQGALLGSTFNLGTSGLASGDSFNLVTERPTIRLRGKTFRFYVRETSSTAMARMFFSDLSFRAIIAKRRI